MIEQTVSPDGDRYVTYDTIGQTYARTRRPDPRFTQALIDALGVDPGALIADVGAGTGNYANELTAHGFEVVAVEPSAVMRGQREAQLPVAWLAAVAERIPLRDGAVDAAMCVFSSHHFADFAASLDELDRIARSAIVFLTIDPRQSAPYWIDEYFPSVWQEGFKVFRPVEQVAEMLAVRTGRDVTIRSLPLPWDLRDLVAAAGWRRPEIYLDPDVRAGMSPFALADQAEVERGVERLERDLASGAWQRSYGTLLQQDSLDVGYRFVIATKQRPV